VKTSGGVRRTVQCTSKGRQLGGRKGGCRGVPAPGMASATGVTRGGALGALSARGLVQRAGARRDGSARRSNAGRPVQFVVHRHRPRSTRRDRGTVQSACGRVRDLENPPSGATRPRFSPGFPRPSRPSTPSARGAGSVPEKWGRIRLTPSEDPGPPLGCGRSVTRGRGWWGEASGEGRCKSIRFPGHAVLLVRHGVSDGSVCPANTACAVIAGIGICGLLRCFVEDGRPHGQGKNPHDQLLLTLIYLPEFGSLMAEV
jgi:hypothetical protein